MRSKASLIQKRRHKSTAPAVALFFTAGRVLAMGIVGAIVLGTPRLGNALGSSNPISPVLLGQIPPKNHTIISSPASSLSGALRREKDIQTPFKRLETTLKNPERIETTVKDPATGATNLQVTNPHTKVVVTIDGKGNVLTINDPSKTPRAQSPPLNKANPSRAGPQAQSLGLETAKSIPPTQITQQLIHGVKGVVSEAPPLIPEIAKTFENQTYTPIVIQETLTVYRAEGSRFGRWFGLEKPDSAGMAERLYNIVDFGNDVMEVSIYDVPKGSVVYVGKVAGGEGHQVFIPNPKKVGVSLKETEHLPQMGH